MAYIDNQSITVDAVLTKKGRELLAKNGNLNITSFALADDEIDYTLYEPNHPNGSAFYDIAIRNTPVFEPLTDETQVMKYKLVTLNQGVTAKELTFLKHQSFDLVKVFFLICTRFVPLPLPILPTLIWISKKTKFNFFPNSHLKKLDERKNPRP
jgi:hypothetical protein